MASFEVQSAGIPYDRLSTQFLVYKFDWQFTGGTAASRYTLLPNIRFVSCSYEEGGSPGSAQFRYVFDRLTNPSSAPISVEECFPYGLTNASNPYVVKQDDRIVVRSYEDNGANSTGTVNWVVLFDGFVQVPQVNLDGEQEIVTFEAFGTPIRLWDKPLRKCLMRNSEDLNAGTDVEVERPMRFNPQTNSADRASGNKTPIGFDVNQGQSNAYPAFVDEQLNPTNLNPGGTVQTQELWTLGPAARHCLWRGNPDQTFVMNPKSDVVDVILDVAEPVNGQDGLIDMSDPSSYTFNPIQVQDLDVTGKCLPEALTDLISPHGFAFRFDLSNAANGDPYWQIIFYRKDVQYPLKQLRLQKPTFPATTALDLTQTNVAGIVLARDGAIINEFDILSANTIYEASFVLFPLFNIASTDADDANLHKWKKGDPNFDPFTYRYFGFDETGDGHWVLQGSVTNPSKAITSLDKVLNPKNLSPSPYVHRRRPAKSSELISINPVSNEPYKAQLLISTDYAGSGGVWDGTGTWQECNGEGWKLAEDRLGIIITAADVSDWNIGASVDVVSSPFPAGFVKVPRCLAAPTTEPGSPLFSLRLTCVIEGDDGVNAQATRRASSPAKFPVRRTDELRDRFIVKVIHKSATANAASPTKTVRDDTTNAQAHVEQRRRAHELLSIHGPMTIRSICYDYTIGDRISKIEGREIGLQQNAATNAGESNIYPCVVGISYVAEPEQQTVLMLNDRRADPPKRRDT